MPSEEQGLLFACDSFLTAISKRHKGPALLCGPFFVGSWLIDDDHGQHRVVIAQWTSLRAGNAKSSDLPNQGGRRTARYDSKSLCRSCFGQSIN